MKSNKLILFPFIIWALLLATMAIIASNKASGISVSDVYPEKNWSLISAENIDLDPIKIKHLFNLSFQDQSTQGAALFVKGKLVYEQYADGFNKDSLATSWSMAKSFYAALIGISIDRGEINSLDDKVSQYLDYFQDDRREMTIRQLLNMSSGLEMPADEHEKMFFTKNHLAYAKKVELETEPGERFEYNNVNSMLLADILFRVTGVRADKLLEDRILKRIGMDNVTLWKDPANNPLSYCCIDTTVRQYARFGLLFARGGKWQDQQIVPRTFIDQTFQLRRSDLADNIQIQRGYSLHWWISRYQQDAKIFSAKGKFGQRIFVDPENDMVFVRVTKYHSTGGDVIDWGPLRFFNQLGSVEFRRKLASILGQIGLINIHSDVRAPMTFDDGISNEFLSNYESIIDALAALNSPKPNI
ncbi:MAG: serine hydrolase domain-containing protein [Porticoccaceae bacterium]